MMKNKASLFKRLYLNPAPIELRIIRDSWGMLSAAIITYLQAFNLPDRTFGIFSATLIFVNSCLVIACVLSGKGRSDEEIQETANELKELNEPIIKDGSTNTIEDEPDVNQ